MGLLYIEISGGIKIKTKLLLIAFILVITIGSLYYYWFVPVEVELEEVSKLYTEDELPGTWWSTVVGQNHSVERKYSIKLPENDYTKHYLIISGGREIKQLTYKRISRLESQYRERSYFGEAILKKALYPHTIFVYRISNVYVRYNDLSWSDVRIEE